MKQNSLHFQTQNIDSVSWGKISSSFSEPDLLNKHILFQHTDWYKFDFEFHYNQNNVIYNPSRVPIFDNTCDNTSCCLFASVQSLLSLSSSCTLLGPSCGCKKQEIQAISRM